MPAITKLETLRERWLKAQKAERAAKRITARTQTQLRDAKERNRKLATVEKQLADVLCAKAAPPSPQTKPAKRTNGADVLSALYASLYTESCVFAHDSPADTSTAKKRPPKPIALNESANHVDLPTFYEGFMLGQIRQLRDADPETIAQDRESLHLWVLYTGNPPLAQIDQATCTRFVAGLKTRPSKKGEPISPNTIRKHCTHIQYILDMAGPRTRKHRSTAALLAEVPYLERPPKREKLPWDAFRFEEIEAFLWACQFAPPIRALGGLDPALFWRSLVIFTWNTGLRRGCTMRAEWSMVDARYPNWISVPPQIYKGHRRGGDFYLNAHARAAIEALRIPGDKLLFPWRNWAANTSRFDWHRRQILAHTGLPVERRLGLHALRKALGTWLMPRNSELAAIVLGHRGGNVTRDCYCSPDAVRELMDSLPQPIPRPLTEEKLLGNTVKVYAQHYVNPALVCEVMNAVPQPTAAVG